MTLYKWVITPGLSNAQKGCKGFFEFLAEATTGVGVLFTIVCVDMHALVEFTIYQGNPSIFTN